MSSGFPPNDTVRAGVPQQNMAMMQGAPVGAQAPVVKVAAKTPSMPVHAETLDKVSGLQKRTPVFRICGTAAEFASGDGVKNRATLSRQYVESMKRPIVTRNRHRAKDTERVGNPSKTIIKRVHLGKAYNGTNKHLVGDIDGIFPEAGFCDGGPAAFNLPRTPHGPIDLNITLEEPINIVTDKMLQFKGALDSSKHDITPDSDPNADRWSLKVKRDIGKAADGTPITRPTFAVALLQDMISEGYFKRIKSIQDGIDRALKDPTVYNITLPREMLEKLKSEIDEGRAALDSGMVDLYDWGITFRPHDGSSWTDHSNTAGNNIGTDMSGRRQIASNINGVTGEAWVECTVEYGMTI